MQLFYDQHIAEHAQAHVIEAEESKHILRVLRKQIGDEIFITDGKGHLFKTEITQATAKKCEVKILEVSFQNPPQTNLHIAIAPTKSSDRFEFFLEKATEIGVSEITPILTQNSERKRINLPRYNRIVQSAMKQSNSLYLPKLNDLTSFDQFIKNINQHTDYYIAHCEDKERLDLHTITKTEKDVCVLIGPEGDFSPEEIDMALKNTFLPISFGSRRLRTETAGIYACMAFYFKGFL
jgi:16S rRNA (uracil1498-N3)-methyltransferase